MDPGRPDPRIRLRLHGQGRRPFGARRQAPAGLAGRHRRLRRHHPAARPRVRHALRDHAAGHRAEPGAPGGRMADGAGGVDRARGRPALPADGAAGRLPDGELPDGQPAHRHSGHAEGAAGVPDGVRGAGGGGGAALVWCAGGGRARCTTSAASSRSSWRSTAWSSRCGSSASSITPVSAGSGGLRSSSPVAPCGGSAIQRRVPRVCARGNGPLHHRAPAGGDRSRAAPRLFDDLGRRDGQDSRDGSVGVLAEGHVDGH